jgi:phosphoesterase RecJ-like protein
MDHLIHRLNNSRNVLITTHASPDGDAIASLLAMNLALQGKDKRITLYNESPIPAVYRFLPQVHSVTSRLHSPAPFDTAVVLDCGDLQRVGEAAGIIGQIPEIINIDHHITNTRFGTCQLIDVQACACTEILHQLFERMNVPFTQELATCIYTGILTDTGSFRFSNTNRTTFQICENMVACGVDPFQVAQHVYGTYSLGRIKLLNLALDSIEISENGKVSLMALTQAMLNETGTQPEDTDGMINYARRIQDVKIAVLIQEQKNGSDRASGYRRPYHVSLRSDGSVDVAAIAAMFGGGGHQSAAGFSVESTLTEIKNRILRVTESV